MSCSKSSSSSTTVLWNYYSISPSQLLVPSDELPSLWLYLWDESLREPEIQIHVKLIIEQLFLLPRLTSLSSLAPSLIFNSFPFILTVGRVALLRFSKITLTGSGNQEKSGTRERRTKGRSDVKLIQPKSAFLLMFLHSVPFLHHEVSFVKESSFTIFHSLPTHPTFLILFDSSLPKPFLLHTFNICIKNSGLPPILFWLFPRYLYFILPHYTSL